MSLKKTIEKCMNFLDEQGKKDLIEISNILGVTFDCDQLGGSITANDLITKSPFTFYFDANKSEEYINLLHKLIYKLGYPVPGYPGFLVLGRDAPQSINQWNLFAQTLPTSSSNGIINIGNINSKQGPQWIVKTDISTAADPILYEYYVGIRLNTLRKYIPNFTLTFAGFQCATYIIDRNDEKALQISRQGRQTPKKIQEFCSYPNPSQQFQFDTRSMKDYIISELVTNPNDGLGSSFSEFSEKAPFPNYAHALLQILCGLQFAQNELLFTHNDLHAENVLRQKLPEQWGDNVLFLYNFSLPNVDNIAAVIPIPTDTIYTIIDFGRCFIKDTPQNVQQLWTPSLLQNISPLGITPYQFNPITDAFRVITSAFENRRTNYPNSRSEKIATTLLNDLQTNNCIISNYATTNTCGGRFKQPSDIIIEIERYLEPRVDRIQKAKNIVWLGYPPTADFANKIMKHYGIRRDQRQFFQNQYIDKPIPNINIKPPPFTSKKYNTQLMDYEPLYGGGSENQTISYSSYSDTSSPSLGNVDAPFTCLYLNGQLLLRNDMIEILKKKNLWKPNLESLTDNQLCIYLQEKVV